MSLKAYGSNVEKLFHVKPKADPEDIKVGIKGTESIFVNEEGELEVITKRGTVKFTRPVAFQEINGKKVKVAVEYDLLKSEIKNLKCEF